MTVRVSGHSVFAGDVDSPGKYVGEVYALDEEGREWYGWVRPEDGSYVSARAASEPEVLRYLATVSGLTDLRSRRK